MSWIINVTGKPKDVVIKLEDHSNLINGQSKIEFDAALPHIVGLVNENFGTEIITISASGHGDSDNTYRHCSVNIY